MPSDCERMPAGGGGGGEVPDAGANCSCAAEAVAAVAGVDTALLVADEPDVRPALSGTDEAPEPDDPAPDADAGPAPENEVGGDGMSAVASPLGTGVATPTDSAADADADAEAPGMLIISMSTWSGCTLLEAAAAAAAAAATVAAAAAACAGPIRAGDVSADADCPVAALTLLPTVLNEGARASHSLAVAPCGMESSAPMAAALLRVSVE